MMISLIILRVMTVFLIDICVERDFRFHIEGVYFYLEPKRPNAGKDISLGGIAAI